LLARSPELVEIARRVPAVRRGIERGRPHQVYRALLWARVLGRLGDLAPTGKALLAHRRIFVRPLTRAPVMFTYNTVGTFLYGRSDVDSNDGTYVATLYAVMFLLPIFPIGSYLVRDGSQGGLRRSWGFLAKVPLAATTYLWQRAIALGLLGLLAVGAANAMYGFRHGTLHVANGLDRAVRVQVGSAAVDVAAGGVASLDASVGHHPIRVTDGGRIVEQGTVDVPRRGTALVWNVLGAAPVFDSRVVYTAEDHDGDSSDSAPPQVFCGESLVRREDVDFLFKDPPQRMSMSEHEKRVVKRHVGVGPGGWKTCVHWLTSHGDTASASHVAMRVLSAQRAMAAQFPEEAEGLLAVAPVAEGEAFAKELLSRDDSIDAHRIYQNLLIANEQRPRVRAEYEARLVARPNDADSEYLVLRVRPNAEERQTIDPAVARHPDHAFLRRTQLWVHYADRQFAPAVAAAEALRRLDPALWAKTLEPHVESLVALDRGQEAFDLAQAVAHDEAQGPRARQDAEELAFRVAHRLGTPEPALSASDDEEGARLRYLRTLAGVEVSQQAVDGIKDDRVREALRIARAARTNPDAALALARKANAATMGAVPLSVRTMLLAEAAARREAHDFLVKLAWGGLPGSTIDAMAAYVTGGDESDDLVDMPLELRAALDLGRSRMAALPAAERRRARERALQSDVLRGPVTVALQGWPS
jgi:hypothetical protein